MKIIQENPFRIVGVTANCSIKDLLKQKNEISAFAKVGKSVPSEYDFPFLLPMKRAPESIERAFSDIEQNQNKINYALFWFVNSNPIDNTAIRYLINGDKEKAIEIWEKITDGKEITAKNFAAFNNIGTLYLLEQSEDKIKQGIATKIKLIESIGFKDFAKAIAYETFIIDPNKQIQIFIDEVLHQLKDAPYSTTQTVELFSGCNGNSRKYITKKFTGEPIYRIETKVEQTKKKRKENRQSAYQLGKDLFGDTVDDWSFLKFVLNDQDLQFQMLSDKLAKEILQCSIDYYNENVSNSQDYLEKSIQLSELARKVAIGNSMQKK